MGKSEGGAQPYHSSPLPHAGCISGHNTGLVLTSYCLIHLYISANALGVLVSQRSLGWSLGPWYSHVGEVNLQEAGPSTNRLGYGNHIQEDWSIYQRTPVLQGVSFYYMSVACVLGLFCIQQTSLFSVSLPFDLAKGTSLRGQRDEAIQPWTSNFQTCELYQ